MRQTMEQELFKAMSNRTRTQPREIYNKITNHIQQLQHQVIYFNHQENEIPLWLKEETNKLGGRPKVHSLKMMTVPKFQNLLLNCDLLLGDSNTLKNSKIARKFTNKSSKDVKINSFLSTSKSFNVNGLRSRTQNNSTKMISKLNAESINKTKIQSTMIQSSAKGSLPLSYKNDVNRREMNFSLTESIILEQPENQTHPLRLRNTPPSLRQQIQKKQKLLLNEWQKTERYHKKLSNWIGQEGVDRTAKTINIHRVNEVIQKIKKSRPNTSENTNLFAKVQLHEI